MAREYQICTRCVMDTTDPDITFDSLGICNHCHSHDAAVRASVRTGERGRIELEQILDEVRRAGARKPYDCVIGVSGGVDSTYVAYLVKEHGLRPLAVHLDNGWDSELAVKNIEVALRTLGIDLHTHVLDWPEFRDLQLAFLRASTPDSEIPTDHAISALIRHTAHRLGVHYMITGVNVRTETHLPLAWSQGHSDWRYIRSVHEQFGTIPLRSFPHMGFWTYRRYHHTQSQIDLLNYVDYVKDDAMRVLQSKLNWKYYGGKHFESIYTRFYQGYILPTKFGFDKRRAHLSSLVCSGERSREAALSELETPPYSPELQAQDKIYVAKKLGLTEPEFEAIMRLPKRSYWDFPSYGHLYQNRAFIGLRRLYHRVRAFRNRGLAGSTKDVVSAN